MSVFLHKEQKLSVVLDIGSASIGGSLVLFDKKQIPQILYTTRVPLPITEDLGESELTRLMAKTLRKVFGDISKIGLKRLNFLKMKGKRVDSIHCVFASPWFMAETKTERVNKSITLTPDYINNLVKKEKKSFEGRLAIDGEVSLIEQKIIHTKLNGYTTSSPYNKMANNAEITFFLSIVPKNILDIIEKISDLHFNIDEVTYHSFTLVSYKTLMDIFPEDSNAVIFDITGEVTDISVIEDDSLVKILSMPIGRNTVARDIAKRKKVSHNVALSYLDLYVTGSAEPRLQFEVENSVSSIKKIWDKEIVSILPRIEGKTIFITADSEVFSKYLIGADPKKVINVSNKHFNNIVLTKKGTKEDVFLSTDVFFINKLINHV